MTIAQKNSIAKAATLATGLSLAFGAFAPALNAQTTSVNLQAQLAALLAQVQTLQAQLSVSNSGSMAGGVNPGTVMMVQPTFSRDLSIGATGSDVTSLQNWLITNGYSIPAGASGYFGAQTQSAVSAWQQSAGLPATGYFGSASRAKIAVSTPPHVSSSASGCSTGAMYSTVTGQPCAMTVSGTSGGDATLNSQMSAIDSLQNGLSSDISNTTSGSDTASDQ